MKWTSLIFCSWRGSDPILVVSLIRINSEYGIVIVFLALYNSAVYLED